jgi:hypothetical protein
MMPVHSTSSGPTAKELSSPDGKRRSFGQRFADYFFAFLAGIGALPQSLVYLLFLERLDKTAEKDVPAGRIADAECRESLHPPNGSSKLKYLEEPIVLATPPVRKTEDSQRQP